MPTNINTWPGPRRRRAAIVAVCAVVAATLLTIPARSEPIGVTVAGQPFTAAGINTWRSTDSLVVYTRTGGQTATPTNRWGAEATVVDGKITALSDRQTSGAGPTPIPVGGQVLSGHGAARTWLLQHATIGAPVTIQGIVPAAGTNYNGAVVTADNSAIPLLGADIPRSADSVVAYTVRNGTANTPTNRWGAEAVVVAGKVTQVVDRQTTGAGPVAIPVDGYVLSGHGTGRNWIIDHLQPGVPSTVAYRTATVPADCRNGTVRLTFDDGPHPVLTPQILDILKAHGSKATFFVMGKYVDTYPEVVARAAAEGHKIGNHTWSHSSLPTLTASQVASELSRTSTEIRTATGSSPTEWRPPYEQWTPQIRDIAAAQGMSMVLWDYATDSNDWRNLTPEQVAANATTNAGNGSVILMHDIHQRSVQALPLILNNLKAKGLCAA